MDEDRFVKRKGFDVAGALENIKTPKDFMRPIFEAVGNSLDATSERGKILPKPITIWFHFQNPFPDGEVRRLEYVEIIDNGIGFTDANYARFLSLNDRSKNETSKGVGRVQFIKAFVRADFESVFVEDGVLMKRAFSLSGTRPYLDRNALVRETTSKTLATSNDDDMPGTRLKLLMPFTDGRLRSFESASLAEIKERLVARFVRRLRYESSIHIPEIDVGFWINGRMEEKTTITQRVWESPNKYLINAARRRREAIEKKALFLNWKLRSIESWLNENGEE